jgi:hypothetical protein
MAGFNTQFHATRDELIDLIESWMDQHPIVVSAFAFPPTSRVPISRETVRAILSSRPEVDSLSFTMVPVDPVIDSSYDVACAGLGPMQLNIGPLKSTGLEESSLSSIDPNPLWKKLNNQFKRKTTAGANYVEDAAGSSTYSSYSRFTAGAKQLFLSGTPLRPLGGGERYSFHPK